MRFFKDKFGFTLMEVNLAIFIMAVGVLGMVALYPLGFQESRQARDDVVEAAVADGVLNPLVAALSSCASNITWQAWKEIVGTDDDPVFPNQGWFAYCDQQTYTPKSKSQINSQTRTVLSQIASRYKGSANPVQDAQSAIDNSGMACALVISAGELPTLNTGAGSMYSGYWADRSRIILCLRIARNASQLFEQPAFYTEVKYQCDPSNTTAGGTP